MVFIAECKKCNSFKIFSIIYTCSFTLAHKTVTFMNGFNRSSVLFNIGNGYRFLNINYSLTYTHTHAHTISSEKKKKRKSTQLWIWKSINKIIYIKFCRLGSKLFSFAVENHPVAKPSDSSCVVDKIIVQNMRDHWIWFGESNKNIEQNEIRCEQVVRVSFNYVVCWKN